MGPVMELGGDYWEDDYRMDTIEVDCLLPTGIIIMLSVARDATISEIKAVRIFSMLHSSYIVVISNRYMAFDYYKPRYQIILISVLIQHL